MIWNAHNPLIAILRGIRPIEIEAHVDALVDAGVTLIEIPTNSPHWSRSVKLAVRRVGQAAVVGAGTVLTTDHVDALLRAGGKLMVTPNTEPALIRRAVDHGLTCAAGFASPSEAFAALGAGAQALKLFPAATLGPGYVRALKAVLPPEAPLFAVGGVTLRNLGKFLRGGCAGAGLGNDLYTAGQQATLTRSRATAFIESYKGSLS